MLFTILYERYSTYLNGEEIRRAKIENIECSSLDEMLKEINNNEKFLMMREDDVIDFTKSEELESTGFNIISIKDDAKKSVYSRDSTLDLDQKATIIINTYLGGELYGDKANVKEIKEVVQNQIEFIQNIFTKKIKKIELLVGDCVCYFGDSRGDVESSISFTPSDINNLETIIKNNIEEEIVSKGSSISEFIENGYFCFNYHVADNRFNDNYNDLHKLIPIFLEVAIEESSYFHIFHIPSNEYLSIDEIPDIEGSEGMMKEFIKYIE